MFATIAQRAGIRRPVPLLIAGIFLAAGCYSSDYSRQLRANTGLIADLASKLTDYCRSDFELGGRRVSSEEMGEFYYALKKADSFAAMEKDSAGGRRSMKEFQRLLDLYRDFLEAADRSRLAGKPDASLRYAALVKAVRIKPQAVLVLGALGEESSER